MGVAAPSFLLALLLAASAFAREVVPLDAGWAFHLGDVAGAQQPSLAPADWQPVDLPHDWSISLPVSHDQPSKGGGGFFPGGIGWYRHVVRALDAWKGQRVSIEFDGVYMNSEVWVNGVALGIHPYGYTPFQYDLTPHLNFGAENVIAVRVDNSRQPNSRWYSGSGIYRHVRLVVTDPVHVVPDGVFVRTASLSEKSAVLQAGWQLRNEGNAPVNVVLQAIVLDPLGHDAARFQGTTTIAAHGEVSVPASFSVAQPHPWSPATPVRYRLVTRLSVNGRSTDETVAPFGIRTVHVSAERGFELNGREMKLLGGNVHHDNGPLGAAAFDRAEERRVRLMKDAGFNAIRTSHNPPSPAFLEACDRLGMLVLDEAFDCWEKGKNAHDFSVVFKEWWQRDVDAMVRRDRNHPCVIMWSIGNEMPERANANGLRIARELTARIREQDPSRPITAGVNGPGKGDWTKFDPLLATMDVAGYNYELARHAADHARVPGRVILVTESYQSETFANWAVARDNAYVIGDFVWSGMDYLGEAGIGRVYPPGEPIVKHWEGDQFPWHGAACGDIELIGDRKPVSHYRNIVWDRGERLYAAVVVPSPDGRPWGVSPWTVTPVLASWTWPGQDGRELAVDVYSRHERVRLYLNDRLLGEKPTSRAEEFRANFAVPYAPGTLRAVGVDADHEEETFTLQTAGAPTRINLSPDRTVARADGEDLLFVTVAIEDAQGRLVPTTDRDIRFAVRGPATIAGIGSADLTTSETYLANPHRTFQGRELVVLRSTHESGIVTLTATADGLSDGATTVQMVANK